MRIDELEKSEYYILKDSLDKAGDLVARAFQHYNDDEYSLEEVMTIKEHITSNTPEELVKGLISAVGRTNRIFICEGATDKLVNCDLVMCAYVEAIQRRMQLRE